VPQIIVGLTVVAYGTSAPELIVGIQAAVAGRGEVALGNVVGSNIANIGLILGLATLTRPARVHDSLRRREMPVLLLSAAMVPALMLDGRLALWEALGLLVLAAAYTTWMVRATLSTMTSLREVRKDASVTASAADAAGAPHRGGSAWSLGIVLMGLVLLLLGGHLFVGSAVSIARAIGISDRIVGLTIVALGTSLPELVTSVVAAIRGHSDIAIGNVVGSNIFNVLLCLGGAGLSGAVEVDLRAVSVELAVMVVMTLLAAVYIRRERSISRTEGAVALALYAVFIAFILSHAA
jgi:cation:H+ antiporter